MKNDQRSEVWKAQLERLAAVRWADAGLFVLGVHALIEAWINVQDPKAEGPKSYWEISSEPPGLRSKLYNYLKSHKDTEYIKSYKILKNFYASYEVTNRVRHEFAQLDANDAETTTENLMSFSLSENLITKNEFDEIIKKFKTDLSPDGYRKLQQQYEQLSRQFESGKVARQQLEADLGRYRQLKGEIDVLQDQIAAMEILYQGSLDKARTADEKYDQLRRKLFEKEQELKGMSRVADYARTFFSMHLRCRTQVEFQKSLLKLSREQEGAIRNVRPGENLLIRGGAGTGKSLVLLAALQKVCSAQAAELGFDGPQDAVLLTYTRTLQRYSLWLLKLLGGGLKEENVQGIDSFILHLGRQRLNSGLRLVYEMREVGVNMAETTWDELENFVWAGGLSREDYLEKRLSRKGRRNPLKLEERSKVWEAGEEALHQMLQNGVVSRSALSYLLWRDCELNVNAPLFSVIAVDEVQDLRPVDLKILRKITQTLLMAGDISQQIFNTTFSMGSLGIDIRGRSRILKLSYRSTQPLARLATHFLKHIPVDVPGRTGTISERFGLVPRLLRYAGNKDKDFISCLFDSLEFYCKVLDYDPASLAILAPSRQNLDDIRSKLEEKQYTVTLVQDSSEWMNEKGIRLCTIQSAKGLDFPVVITVIPKLPFDQKIDDETRHAQKASLVYVAITRAMENLTVILPKNTEDTVLNALVQAFTDLENNP